MRVSALFRDLRNGTIITSGRTITYTYRPVVRAKLDIALWPGLYVIYNPVVSFDPRCQSGIYIFIRLYVKVMHEV